MALKRGNLYKSVYHYSFLNKPLVFLYKTKCPDYFKSFTHKYWFFFEQLDGRFEISFLYANEKDEDLSFIKLWIQMI